MYYHTVKRRIEEYFLLRREILEKVILIEIKNRGKHLIGESKKYCFQVICCKQKRQIAESALLVLNLIKAVRLH
jgi:hypothetical protein